MSEGPKALIITVNFQHTDCTLQFLQSASRLERFGDCHLLIVDNNSGDDSAERIEQAIDGFKNVQLLRSPANRGYFGAAKWALEQCRVYRGATDWVIVCNNDIVFDDPSFLVRLLAHDPQAAGVLAPAIVSSLTGFDANPMISHRPGGIRRLRYRFLASSYYVAWLTQWLAPFVRKGRRRLRLREGRPNRRNGQSRIYAPHGSFFIFSHRYFDEGGFIDDGCFLYAEEISVAETCWQLGLPVLHDPELKVSHNDSQTTGRRLTRTSYLRQKEGLHYALGKYLESGRGA
ncbi:MAG: glycosyltransferase [Terriglobales bacterium]